MAKNIYYRVKDVVCVKNKSGEYVPFIFNNSGTKVQNILNGEIINFYQSVYSFRVNGDCINSDWIKNHAVVEELFCKFYQKCQVYALDTVLKEFKCTGDYENKNYYIFEKIRNGCNLLLPQHVEILIKKSSLIKFVKDANKSIKKQEKERLLQDKKRAEGRKEAEQSHDF